MCKLSVSHDTHSSAVEDQFSIAMAACVSHTRPPTGKAWRLPLKIPFPERWKVYISDDIPGIVQALGHQEWVQGKQERP